MRCSLFILFLSAGIVAFGQAGPSAPFTPEPLGQSPSFWTSLGRDFSKMPPQQWSALSSLQPQTVLVPPTPRAQVKLGDASIDPRMVLHPSAKDLGAQPPGTQVAQNLFPGLTFQPVNDSARGEQRCGPNAGLLSTTWPGLKVERIPITWPNLKMDSVAGAGQASSIVIPRPQR